MNERPEWIIHWGHLAWNIFELSVTLKSNYYKKNMIHKCKYNQIQHKF